MFLHKKTIISEVRHIMAQGVLPFKHEEEKSYSGIWCILTSQSPFLINSIIAWTLEETDCSPMFLASFASKE